MSHHWTPQRSLSPPITPFGTHAPGQVSSVLRANVPESNGMQGRLTPLLAAHNRHGLLSASAIRLTPASNLVDRPVIETGSED